MTVGDCLECLKRRPLIECVRCKASFCHRHFEFHDCNDVLKAVAAVTRILADRRDRPASKSGGGVNDVAAAASISVVTYPVRS
jgi:hypothetical protein